MYGSKSDDIIDVARVPGFLDFHGQVASGDGTHAAPLGDLRDLPSSNGKNPRGMEVSSWENHPIIGGFSYV